MGNLTRADKRKLAAVAAKRARKADTVEELMLVFMIGGEYVVDYYSQRPVRRFLAKYGIRNSKLGTRCMDRAKDELSEVNYDYAAWKGKYGKSDKVVATR
ncbi:hypothetical protein [Methylobacter sp.]